MDMDKLSLNLQALTYKTGKLYVTIEKSPSFNYIDIKNEDGVGISFMTCDIDPQELKEALITVTDLLPEL